MYTNLNTIIYAMKSAQTILNLKIIHISVYMTTKTKQIKYMNTIIHIMKNALLIQN